MKRKKINIGSIEASHGDNAILGNLSIIINE
jgi:hypothetical protein